MGPPYSSPKATPQRSATSRLLAMKFMNRLSTGDSPLASGPSTPTSQAGSMDEDTRVDSSVRSSQKRRRGDDEAEDEDQDGGGDDNDNISPSSAKRRRVSAAADVAASTASMESSMRAALAEEERRRQAAVAKRAAELGDEHWTWNAPLPPHVAAKLAASTEAAGAARARMPFAVVRVGYAEIDSQTAEAATAAAGYPSDSNRSASLTRLVNSMKPGIMRYNMKAETSTSADDETDQNRQQANGSSKAARKQRAQMSGGAADAQQKGKDRKKEAAKLKNLTSLSSQGGQSSMKCHRCGRSGHKAVECPSAQRRPGLKKR